MSEPGTKFCKKCGNEYPATTEYFFVDKRTPDKLSLPCKECKRVYRRSERGKAAKRRYIHSERGKAYRQGHKAKEADRHDKYKRRYGLGIKDYNQLFQKQDGCCVICNRHQSELKRRLDVDHDHETKKVRALLCNRCNRALGIVGDDAELLKKLTKYLGRF